MFPLGAAKTAGGLHKKTLWFYCGWDLEENANICIKKNTKLKSTHIYSKLTKMFYGL